MDKYKFNTKEIFKFPYSKASELEEIFCKLNGHGTAIEYRKAVSSNTYIKDIKIPVMYYFSFDDPVIGKNSIDFESIY
jgi:predicted alpha/beta-fold hydrolase